MGPYRVRLDVLRIKDPCPERWDAMEGDGPMRFCGVCRQNVYDLSELTGEEAEELLSLFEGSSCVRMRRRPDGRLISADCTDARQRAKRRRVIRLMAAGAASVGLVAATFGIAEGAATSHRGAPCAVSMSTGAPGVRDVASMGEVQVEVGRSSVRDSAARHPFEGSWIDPDELSLDPPE